MSPLPDRLHLLVTTVPIPAHTLNAAPFVRAFLDRGHAVSWYAGEPFAPLVERLGARHLSFTRVPQPALRTGGSRRLTQLRTVRRLYRNHYTGPAAQRFADVDEVLSSWRPVHADGPPFDVLLTDAHSYGAGAAATRHGLPWASFGDGPLVFADRDTPPYGSGLGLLPSRKGRRRNRVVSAVTNRVLLAQAAADLAHLPVARAAPGPVPVLAANLSPQLHLQCCTPGLEYPREELGRHVRWVGPLRHPVPEGWRPPQWWPRLDEGRPTVLVSQGTLRGDVGELIVPTIRALGDGPFFVVATTGGADASDVERRLGSPLPPNVVVEPHVPYAALLPRINAFVTNGGYTSVVWALAHGIPIVQAGSTEEKADIGARVRWAGAGIRIATTTTRPRQVSTAVRALLNEPAYRRRAEALQAEMAGLDAGVLGADALERLACESRSTPTPGSPGATMAPPTARPA